MAETPSNHVPEDEAIIRAYAEDEVRGPASDLARQGIDSPDIREQVEVRAQQLSNETWARHLQGGQLPETYSARQAETARPIEDVVDSVERTANLDFALHEATEPYFEAFVAPTVREAETRRRGGSRKFESSETVPGWLANDEEVSYELDRRADPKGDSVATRCAALRQGKRRVPGVVLPNVTFPGVPELELGSSFADTNEGRFIRLKWGDDNARQLIEEHDIGDTLRAVVQSPGEVYRHSIADRVDNVVTVSLADRSLTVNNSTYVFDADRNELVNQRGGALSPEQYLDVANGMLRILPTVDRLQSHYAQ